MIIIDIILTFLIALLNIAIMTLYSIFREKNHSLWLNNIVAICLAPFFFFVVIYPMLVEFWLESFWEYNFTIGIIIEFSTYLIYAILNRKKIEKRFNLWNHGR